MSEAKESSDGIFVRIPTGIFEKLMAIRISGEARQCLDFIIRKTYGWGKPSDRISLSQFAEATGIPKPEVIRALKKLQAMNIVGKKANDLGVFYSVNEKTDSWKPLAKKQILAKKPTSVGKKANTSLAKKPHTIDTNTKETIQKKVSPLFSEDSIEFKCANGFFRILQAENPKMRPPNLQHWAADFDKMLRIDKRTTEEMKEMIRFARGDPFWQKNILSPEKLRKHWDTLFHQMNAGPVNITI